MFRGTRGAPAIPARSRSETPEYYERLARLVLDGHHGATQAAVALFEHHEPLDVPAAALLVSAHGDLSPSAFERIGDAFDVYRLQRDMACD